MAIKRVFTVKDENYGENFELFGKYGYYENENIKMFDTCAFAQACIENVASELNDDDIYEIDKTLLKDNVKSILNDIMNELFDEIIINALSDIDEDEELVLVNNNE